MKDKSSWVSNVRILLLCLALIGLSRFLFASGFGLYEDDYTRIPRALTMSGDDLAHELVTAFSGFVDHGKPLHPVVIYSLAMIGAAIGGIRGIYLVAYLVVGANAVLFILLMRRIASIRFAALAGISFALFSADITQAFLTHALGLQTAITFLLVAFHAYAGNRKFLAYVFTLALLLTYETPYPVFLVAPVLLDKPWGRCAFRSILMNALVMGVLLLGIIVIRANLGETRISGLTFPEWLTIPLLHMVQGPIVSMGTYIYRPFQALTSLPATVYLGLIPVFVILYWTIFQFHSEGRNGAQVSPARSLDISGTGLNTASFFANLRRWFSDGVRENRLLLSGLMMLILAYPLTFTVRAYALSGRDTRVHLAAALGAAIVWAWIWDRILAWLTTRRTAWVGGALLAGLFTLTVGFGLLVQVDMIRAWNLQRELWASIAAYVPDIEEGTTILIDPGGLTDTWAIDANTWAMPLVMPSIFQFPGMWDELPTAHRLLPDWRARSLWNSTELKAVDFEWQYVITAWDRTVILETAGNRVSRRLESIELNGEYFTLKLRNPAYSMLEANTLYPFLLR